MMASARNLSGKRFQGQEVEGSKSFYPVSGGRLLNV